MNDKKSCNHLIGLSPAESCSSFNFCPLCGKPLKNSALDKLLLKTFGLENSELNPGQSVEDALEAFFERNYGRCFDAMVSFDKVVDLETGKLIYWDTAIRGEWFQDKSLKRSLTKALLWATTELTKEEVEELFQKGASHDSQQS